jgi:hypothetical protein
MKKKISMILIACSILMMCSSCSRWLIYHKPEFKGKIIDAETKEPIEGAVVVVYYRKETLGLGDSTTSTIHWTEVLTDKNGEFIIPSYTTLTQPFSGEDFARFIIYKPGYESGSDFIGNPEDFFLPENMGKKHETSIGMGNGVIQHIQYTYGVVELKKLTTREERLNALPSLPSCCSSKELPILFKLRSEEEKKLGLGRVK